MTPTVLLRRRALAVTAPAILAAVILLTASRTTPPPVLPPGAPRDMLRVVVRDTLVQAPPLAREFRGAWLSPAADGDWPSREGLSAKIQQRELIALLDRAKEIGLNAIIFHVRTSADALYETKHAPWSARLTGTQGVSPGYDPLELVVREAHARGLQVHAWFNPFRASLDGGIRAASNHVTKTHPSWVRRYGSQLWMDPGIPEVRASVLETILDVVRRYDIDGVHLDDFFYPYRELRTYSRPVGRGRNRRWVSTTRELDFSDDASWRRYGSGRFRSRHDWRRDNINDFIRTLYTSVHATKPWVTVGISPFGIWRPGAPPGIQGLDAYREIYADARKWLREGWVDYLAPQLYWPLEAPENRFRLLDAWWRTQNPHERHLWPGLYTAGAVGRAPWPSEEIARQIETLREARMGTLESQGHVHFRIGSMQSSGDTLARYLGDLLSVSTYRVPALVPEMAWLGGKPPAAPLAALAEQGDDDGPTLLLGMGDSTALSWWVIQSRASGTWSTNVVPATTRQLVLASGDSLPDVVVVSAIDRVGQQSGRTVVRVRR